ncbi:Phytochrome E [Linum grandiflorum]
MGFDQPHATTAAVSSSSAASNMRTINDNTRGKATIAQFNADAGLQAEFERSGMLNNSFNYSRSFLSPPAEPVPEEQVAIYLSRIQRGGFIQPFGCLLAIEETSFRVIGYSENCFELLGLGYNSIPGKRIELIGIDARTLFTPSSGASLARAASASELSFLNPVWVYSRMMNKPFYAILHRVDVGIVIDLEPARSSDPALSRAGAVQSQKLAVQAISRLQSLPGGDIGVLCDTVVEDVQKLTGYDRVMVYKFHEDEHGEVVSEVCRKSDLEPYLGLHYPATDIPQAARFLFKQNRVRMICDCNADQVKVVQSSELMQPLLLVNSTLRSPHGCHSQYMANMGSIASLVLAVAINGNDSSKLWGLVVCHHSTPRYVPFPQRYACEFLMQAFGLQLYMELQLAAQFLEKKVLKTQTLLCDMLLRDAPFGVVTQSPSIMDLVRCDGAALYYNGKSWLLGVTPNESQIGDLVKWLLDEHGDSTGLTTDSLADAGYPGASLLGNAVCGVATARIAEQGFLFWFRSHTAKEVKWGGAKHHPEDKDDDGGKMHPRSSFKAFLEVVKRKSLPWEVSEINAIHSLQLIMRHSFQEMEDSKALVVDTEMDDVAELSSVATEMARLIETATAPIFGVDLGGFVNGWNAKVADLTGLPTGEAMGKSFVREIVHEDSRGEVDILLTKALQGEEEKNVELKLRRFSQDHEEHSRSPVFIVVNACTSRNYTNSIVGVCFVGQDVTPEKIVMEKFIRLQGDYKAIVQSLNPLIPPIFASDENACCSEWNSAMEKLTGWTKQEVIGKLLPGEIFGSLCQLRGQDALTKFMIQLYKGISGRDTDKIHLGIFGRNGESLDVFVTANRRSDSQGNVIGCFCFLQTVDPDAKHQDPLEVVVKEDTQKLKELAYMRQEIINPLSGIRFTHMLLESTAVSENQKQFLETSNACRRQIMAIVENAELGRIEEGSGVELRMEEFVLGNVLDAIVSQVMSLVMEKKIQLLHEVAVEANTLSLYGDQIRLQLILSDFLLSIVRHTAPNQWVEINVSPGLKLIQDGNDFIRLQFRMTHPGEGLPAALVEHMVDNEKRWTTEEGLALNLSRKLLNRMNGRVRYNREQNRCCFLIDLEFRTKKGRQIQL